jgi:hypothetical protein
LTCLSAIIVLLTTAPAATTAAAGTTAATVSAATARATAAFTLRPCFVHVQSTAQVIRSVQCGDCCIRLTVVWHLDKSKAARAARFAIHQNTRAFHGSILPEKLSQIVFRGVETKAPNKYVFQVMSFGKTLKMLDEAGAKPAPWLNYRYFLGLQTLGAALDRKLNPGAFIEWAIARRFYGTEMHKHVLTILTLDKTKTLRSVEPLYCTLFFHSLIPFLL